MPLPVEPLNEMAEKYYKERNMENMVSEPNQKGRGMLLEELKGCFEIQDVLSKSLTVLEEKLQPVLVPNDQDGMEPSASPPVSSPVMLEILDLNRRMNDLNFRLVELTKRLTV